MKILTSLVTVRGDSSSFITFPFLYRMVLLIPQQITMKYSTNDANVKIRQKRSHICRLLTPYVDKLGCG